MTRTQRLEHAVREAARVFREYEKLHLAKLKNDGTDAQNTVEECRLKASANRTLAQRMEEAITLDQAQIWECKIGEDVVELPPGADGPMRMAVGVAYKAVTGKEAKFCFSGWGGQLTPIERDCVKEFCHD
jgi:hypothetical protein